MHSSKDGDTDRVAASLIVNTISSDDEVHGPNGSSVIKVNVTFTEAKSPALGVYVAFNKSASSNDPVPLEVQVAEVAEPFIEPLSVISSSEQIEASIPAET